MSAEWTILAVYLAGVIPAALLAYPWAVREWMVDPHIAAAFMGVLWPAAVIALAWVTPIWLLSRLVKAVWDR